MKNIIYLFLTLSVLTFNACGPDDDTSPEEEVDTNEAPDASEFNIIIDEGDTTTFEINPTDQEDDQEDLIIIIDELPEAGTLTYNNETVTTDDSFSVEEFNSIVYQSPNVDSYSVYRVYYTVTDTDEATDSSTVSIAIENFVDPIVGTWYYFSDNDKLFDECESKSSWTFLQSGELIIEEYDVDTTYKIENGIETITSKCVMDTLINTTWNNNNNNDNTISVVDKVIGPNGEVTDEITRVYTYEFLNDGEHLRLSYNYEYEGETYIENFTFKQ